MEQRWQCCAQRFGGGYYSSSGYSTKKRHYPPGVIRKPAVSVTWKVYADGKCGPNRSGVINVHKKKAAVHGRLLDTIYRLPTHPGRFPASLETSLRTSGVGRWNISL